jgi:hypothetical protein
MKVKTNNFAPEDNGTKRPGVHAKKKTSNNKESKNYKKSYRGQGR